jgi:putative bacteriocin precursor
LVKLKKKRNNVNSVEAYACMCAYAACGCYCRCSCNCYSNNNLTDAVSDSTLHTVNQSNGSTNYNVQFSSQSMSYA